MKNTQNTRIAARILAKPLSAEEVETVSGAEPGPGATWTVNPRTGRKFIDATDMPFGY